MSTTGLMLECHLCAVQMAETFPWSRDGYHQRCRRCGEFQVLSSALAIFKRDEDLPLLGGWIRDQNRLAEVPIISTDDIGRIRLLPLPRVAERADRLLAAMVERLGQINDTFKGLDPAFIPMTYSKNHEEVHYLLYFLKDEGLVSLSSNEAGHITPRGHAHAEEFRSRLSDSAQGFVAMWFDESMKVVWKDGFERSIQDAGFNAIRVDAVEHIGGVVDQIMAQVRKSRFVVADFTGARAGVYFEAGFAMGLGLPVIWTCRKDWMEKLHFDVRHFSCIDWTDVKDLSKRLGARIEAVVGRGPVFKAV